MCVCVFCIGQDPRTVGFRLLLGGKYDDSDDAHSETGAGQPTPPAKKAKVPAVVSHTRTHTHTHTHTHTRHSHT